MPHPFNRLHIALTLSIIGIAACRSDATPPSNPVPKLSEVNPGVVSSGANGATVTLFGSGFVTDSRAQWNGGDRPTIFLDDSTLRAQLSAQDIANVGEGQFTVSNPTPGGGSSAPLALAIHPPIHSSDSFIAWSVMNVPHRPRAIATANGVFYVAQMDGRSAFKGLVSITTESDIGSLPTAADLPVDVAMDSAGTRAYIANQAGRSVSIIKAAYSTVPDTLIGTVPIPEQAASVLVSADGTLVYVSSVEGHVFIIDPRSGRIVATIPVSPNAYGMALDKQNKRLYVSSRTGPVSAIDLTTNQVVRAYAVDHGSERIALSLGDSTLYVAGQSGLDIVDLATGTYSQFPGLPSGAMAVALLSANTLMITFPSSGVLEIVNLTTRTIVNTISNMGLIDDVVTSRLTSTVLVSDEYGRVFVLRIFG